MSTGSRREQQKPSKWTITYERLIRHLQAIDHLRSVLNLLDWDNQVNLPLKSDHQRGEQIAALAAVLHEKETAEDLEGYLKILEDAYEHCSREEKTVIRETRKNYDRSRKLSKDFVAQKEKLRSDGYHTWVKARQASDFSIFRPCLEEHLAFCKEEAHLLGYRNSQSKERNAKGRVYDYWIDQHDPGLTTEAIEALFDELKQGLIPLVNQITKASPKVGSGILRAFPQNKQEEFVRQVTAQLGFDCERGRIDRSVHPFCSGNGLDCRITTRFFEDAPLDSLFSAIHETGHGLYEQGLPQDHLATPLGKAIGMGVHESQSRLWENQVGRSRAFWKYWEPYYRTLFQEELKGIDSETLYQSIIAVQKNPIRVDSDEVTYNLHIILRFELEKALFGESLSVRDLSKRWNELSREILGFTPENDAQGVLQDVHWSTGYFGYFPSYCLGNMIAAQLWYAVRKDIPDLDLHIEKGTFSHLLQWLRKNIHQWGKQYDTQELVKEVTGENLSPQYLIRHFKERYT